MTGRFLVLLMCCAALLFSTEHSVLQIDEDSSREHLVSRLLKLPPYLRKVLVVSRSEHGRFRAVAEHLDPTEDLTLWEGLYRQYGFTPRRRYAAEKRERVIDFESPPLQIDRWKEGNVTVVTKALGNYFPAVPNRDNKKTGAPRNREAVVSLLASKEPDESRSRCEELFYDSRFDVLDASLRQGYLYDERIDSNESRRQSIVDFDVDAFGNIMEHTEAFDAFSISQMMAGLKQTHVGYMALLNDVTPFLGFYLSGDAGLYLAGKYSYRKQTSYEYRLMARWELFNDGYYEAKKANRRKINETEVEYRQLLADMIDRNYEERLQELQRYTIAVRKSYYTRMEAAYSALLQRREAQLRKGFTTFDDVDHLRERLETMRYELRFYSTEEGEMFDPKLARLIDSLECLRLKPKAELKRYVLSTNVRLKLQDNFIRRADFFPEYADNFKVTLYTSHRRVDAVGWYDVAGVSVDLPIDFDFERAELIRLQKNNYRLQRAAIGKRLEQKIDSLYYQYGYYQTQLTVQKNMLRHLYERMERLKLLSKSRVGNFEADPQRALELSRIDAVDLRYKVLSTRLEMYRILLGLYHVSDADNLAFLFDFGVKQ
jgi:hypothetical protein